MIQQDSLVFLTWMIGMMCRDDIRSCMWKNEKGVGREKEKILGLKVKQVCKKYGVMICVLEICIGKKITKPSRRQVMMMMMLQGIQ